MFEPAALCGRPYGTATTERSKVDCKLCLRKLRAATEKEQRR